MPHQIPRTPELLAPAGGPEALRAAVAAGADAVYLGTDELNARRGAENFTRETLADACRFAHLHGTKVYLTANVVVLPDEMEQALGLVDEAWVAGVDAVIVQDIGLLRNVRATMPGVRVHASTQINTHSTDTLRALSEMGVSRVTLAREVPFEDIGSLAKAGEELGVEIESFAHGALCMCYSGQCLLSSLIGGRSANRGLCAQPCRLPYELVDEADRSLSDMGAHLLSPKDLASVTVLPRLIRTGVAALKLEGRMKSPEYVALVTGVYRAALDRAVELGDAFEVRDGEMAVLSEAFSRGFTEAYLVGERGNEMMSYRRPNNRGVPVGRIASVSGSVAALALEVPVDAQDTIEVWTSRGRFAQAIGPLRYSGAAHPAAPAGSRVEIDIEGQAAPGDRVFRVRNAALSQAASRLFSDKHGPAVGVDIGVSLCIGKPAAVTIDDGEGHSGAARGSVVETARTKAITVEEVAEHVGRLGGTPYEARTWDIELSPGAGFGFSELHRLRREAIEDYELEKLALWSGRKPAGPRAPRLVPASASSARSAGRPLLVVSVTGVEAANACLEAGADRAWVPAWAIPAGERLAEHVVPLVPRVCRDREAQQSYDPARTTGKAVAGNLGALHQLAAEGVEVEADWSLNAVNSYSVSALRELGASFVWLSPELTAPQIADVARHAVVPVGIAVAGRQEIMVTEHCILMAEGPCGQLCASCKRRAGTRFLKDRKGYRFPVVTDVTGRSHVYNSVPLDLLPSLAEVVETGVSAVRIDADTERAQDAASLVRRAVDAFEALERGRTVPKPPTPVTSGHFYRGVG